MRRPDPLVALAIWLMLFGVWPLADPGHHADSPASTLDLALHALAALFLAHRWLMKVDEDAWGRD